MQVKKTIKSETEVVLSVIAKPEELKALKDHVLTHFAGKVRLPGFRQGKAPLHLVEKNVDQNELQSQFIQEAIEQMYPQAVHESGIRPISRPQVELKKFVAFDTLEFDAVVSVLGEIKLADYKKIKMVRPIVKVTDKDITEVIDGLRKRSAEKKDVTRAAEDGDQVWIDFAGKDTKGEPVKGADGKDYPLSIGSKTFIPGFEENLIGLKTGESKSFTLTFPKEYGVKALANKKVTFDVTVTKVQEVIEPKLDDAFVALVSPVKTVAELKADIKKELVVEKQRQSDLDYESNLVREITAKSKLTVPATLISEQTDYMMREFQQNLTYRGQTIKDYLEAEGVTEDEYKKKELAPKAEERVKASLVLAEIAEKEDLNITPEELEIRIIALKGQYQDPQMQTELDKQENRQDIASRMLTEKAVAKLAYYATK